MNQYQQNRRTPQQNRGRGGHNRFENRKQQNMNQKSGQTDQKKNENMDNKGQKQVPEKPSPAKPVQKPSPKADLVKKEPMRSPAPKSSHMNNQSHHKHHHGNQNNDNQNAMQNEPMEPSEPPAPKKFTGRCRLFVGNLPSDTTEDQFRALFTPYGELSELFVNPSRGFGFVRLDTRANAEAAKSALDGVQKKNRVLRVRFATHGAALKIKFLPNHVSNELLEEAFANFGAVERAVVIVDDRGKPTGEAIVEFSRKPAAQQALMKINDGAFLLGASPRPVLAEPLEQKDEDDGYPEKFIMKTQQFHKEREEGPRFAPPGSFEFEMALKWKEVYRMEADHKVTLQREMEQAIARLELEQEQALHEHQAMLLRQDLMRRQEELRKLEERQMEMAKRMEMKRQEEEMRRQEEEHRRQEIMMRQQQESERRRRAMESRARPSGPGVTDDFEMRARSLERARGFNEMQQRAGMDVGRGGMDVGRGGGMDVGRGGGMDVGRGGGMDVSRRGRGDFDGPGESPMAGSGMRRGGGERAGAPPMQPPPAPPAALGLESRQRQGGSGLSGGQGNMGGGQGGMGSSQGNMGGGSQGNMGGGSQGNIGGGSQGNMSGGQGNVGGGQGNLGGGQAGMGGSQGSMGGGQGGNMRSSRFDQSGGSNQGGFGDSPGGNMGEDGGNMAGGRGGAGMNRRREGGPREEFFENKRPRF